MEVTTVCFVLVFILRSTISKNIDVNINVTVSSKPDGNNGYPPNTDSGMCKDLLIFYEFKKSSLFLSEVNILFLTEVKLVFMT